MTKRLSPAALQALEEALSSIYWYKKDLRVFLRSSVGKSQLISSLDWNAYKREIVSTLIEELCKDQRTNLPTLTRLCRDVTEMRSFPHLERLDGGRQKAERASAAVRQLRELIDSHGDVEQEEKDRRERQELFRQRVSQSDAVRRKLGELEREFASIAVADDVQGRGFQLEKFMCDLFELFDLDPKASFRNVGEQVDGAFVLDGTDYLFEAKWQKAPVGLRDLDAFSSKVVRKLENTLGLFLSINGFSGEAIETQSRSTPNTVLMDGADLSAVLEQRIDFVSLLIRKRRHAAQTGEIFLSVQRVLS